MNANSRNSSLLRGISERWTAAHAQVIRVLVVVVGVPLFSGPAYAQVEIATGTFTTPGSIGLDSVTGVGFQPKGLILWGVPVTDESVAIHAAQWFGIADDTSPTRNQKCIVVAGANGVADTRRDLNENAILGILDAESDTPLAEATLDSFDSDGFTLNCSGTPTSGLIVHHVAFGVNITSKSERRWTGNGSALDG